MSKEKYLECAMVASTHGVKGAVKLENRCNTPAILASIKHMYKRESDGSFSELNVINSSVQKNMVIATFDGITTVETAAAMKGTVLFADRSDFKLNKDEHFIADLIGLNVIDSESGEIHGVLSDVISPAGREIYVVSKPDGGQFMIPSVKEFIIRITADGSESDGIYVHLIDGMKE